MLLNKCILQLHPTEQRKHLVKNKFANIDLLTQIAKCTRRPEFNIRTRLFPFYIALIVLVKRYITLFSDQYMKWNGRLSSLTVAL